jgi:hypothetical protein
MGVRILLTSLFLTMLQSSGHDEQPPARDEGEGGCDAC